MATESEQQLLQQGVTQDFIEAERAKGKSGLLGGVNVDPQDMGRILSAFKVSGSPYSSANIASSVAAPATRPDYNDSLSMRNAYYAELGVPQAQKDVQTLMEQLNAFDTGTQQSLDAIENQPLRMGVITGEQAATARSAATTRESIARELAAKNSFLDSARNEANTRLSLKQQDLAPLRELILKTGGKAGITLYDNLETAANKAYEFQVKEAKKEKEETEKKDIRDLYIKTFGAPPKKGASTKDMRKKLEKAAKEDKATKKEMDELDRLYKKAQINSLNSKSGEEKEVKLGDAISEMNGQLQGRRGEDGKLDPVDYNRAKQAWVTAKQDGSKFDSNFGYLINPDRAKEYDLSL